MDFILQKLTVVKNLLIFFYNLITFLGKTCDFSAVKKAQMRMKSRKVEVGGTKTWFQLSWGRFQFRVYWFLVDNILQIPFIGAYIKPYLALFGYILMITM